MLVLEGSASVERRRRRSAGRHEPFYLDEKFPAAKISLEIQEVAGKKEPGLQDVTHDIQVS
jgi:hypothetical protein